MDVDALKSELLKQNEVNKLLISQVQTQTKTIEILVAKLDEMGAKQVELEKLLQEATVEMADAQKNVKTRSERRPKKPGSSMTESKPTNKPRNNHNNLELFEETVTQAGEICSVCNQPFKSLSSFEERELVHAESRVFQLRRLRRAKCKCGCGFSTAPTPDSMPVALPKARYSAAFMVMVAASRFVQHLPYARQAKAMRHEGLEIQRQQLYEGVYALYRLLEPALGERLRRAVLAHPVVGADETGWPMLEKGRKNWQILALQTPKASFFTINPSKEAACCIDALTVRDEHGNLCVYDGTLQTDGAGNFASVVTKLDLGQAQCWAHARRKFFDAAQDHKQAEQMLDLIGELYAVEAEARGADDLLASRKSLRAERSRAIFACIKRWCLQHASEGWSSSSLRKAINYVSKRWEPLGLFLKDPAIDLDNNGTERSLRGPVLGRKNYYGSKSRLGTQINAFFYSLVDTAQKNGLNFEEYLLGAVTAMLEREQPDLPMADEAPPRLKLAPSSLVQGSLI